MRSLVKKDDRDFGLPRDVFENPVNGLSLSASVKFLSISNASIFQNLKVKKRKSEKKK